MTMPDAPGRLKARDRARRQGRRDRSAPHRDREARERAPLHPARQRRGVPARARAHAVRRGSRRRSARRRAASSGLDDGARRSRASSRPRRSPTTAASRPRRSGASRASSRPRSRRRATAGSAPACRSSARSRAGAVDLVNILTGNLDRPGGVMFTTPAAPLDAGAADAARASRSGRWKSRVSGQPEVEGLIPSSTMARGDAHAGRRPGARDDPADDQPAAQRRELRRSSSARSRASTSSSRSTSTSTRPRATRTSSCRRRRRPSRRATRSASTCSRCATSRSGRGRPCRRRRSAPETWQVLSSDRRAAAWASASCPSRRSTTSCSAQFAEGAVDGRRAGRASPSTRWSRRSTAGSAPSASSTCCCASARYGDGFGRRPDGLTLAKLQEAPHGIDLGPLEPRLARGDQHRERHDRAGAADDDRTTSPRLRAHIAKRAGELRADRAARPALQQLVHAQPAGAREGPRPLHAAGLARRTPTGSASRTAAPRASRAGSAASSRRSRSPTT